MKYLFAMAALAAVAACGAETATTAATGAAIKKQEVEQAKQALDGAQAKIGQALAQAQQRTQAADDAADAGPR